MSLFSPFQSVMQSLKGRQYRKFIKKCAPVVVQINKIEEGLQSLSDDELRGKTNEFMQRFKDGTSLDDLLPEAFAVVKTVPAGSVVKPLMCATNPLNGKWCITMCN